jgi:perosamine synthetase
MSHPLPKSWPSTSAQPMLPYGRQWIEEADIAAVGEVLRSDWLTTGPAVPRFEEAVAQFVGARCGVAVSSGTAALHAAMYAAGIGPGDEVIVPPISFAATANAVVFQGGTPVFADIDADTLLLDPAAVADRITPRTKAILAVDYAGQACDYEALRAIADRHGLVLVADACHSLGGTYRGRPVGTLADLTVFSFHPVKHITTGEGGMIATTDEALARRMRSFRNHGISTDHRERSQAGGWFYEMEDLGYNYRLSDFQCALGTSQLRRLPEWIARRQAIAGRYDAAFQGPGCWQPLGTRPEIGHARHLYVVKAAAGRNRNALFQAFRELGIGVNVHYIPIHLHPFYRRRFGTGPGLCPRAEEAYTRILSLPIYPRMKDEDVERVIAAARNVGGPGQ